MEESEQKSFVASVLSLFCELRGVLAIHGLSRSDEFGPGNIGVCDLRFPKPVH